MKDRKRFAVSFCYSFMEYKEYYEKLRSKTFLAAVCLVLVGWELFQIHGNVFSVLACLVRVGWELFQKDENVFSVLACLARVGWDNF